MSRKYFRNFLFGMACVAGVQITSSGAMAQAPGAAPRPKTPSLADSPNNRGIAQPSRSNTFSTQGGLNGAGTETPPAAHFKQYNYPTEPDFDPRVISPYDRRFPRYQYRAPSAWSAGWGFSGNRRFPRYGDYGVPYSPRVLLPQAGVY